MFKKILVGRNTAWNAVHWFTASPEGEAAMAALRKSLAQSADESDSAFENRDHVLGDEPETVQAPDPDASEVSPGHFVAYWE